MSCNLSAGHGTNVTSMQLLIANAMGWGTKFNPIADRMKLQSLQTAHQNGESALLAVDAVYPANANARNTRELIFAPLNDITTRVMNAFISIEPNELARARVRSAVNLVQMGRVNRKKSVPVVKDAAIDPPVDEENDSHKLAYEVRVTSLYRLIQLLLVFPNYTPNEEDLTVAALTTRYNDMKDINQVTIDTAIPLKRAREARDLVLYEDVIGLVPVGNDTKRYVKSVFGARSPEYKSIAKLKFRDYNH
jgi:hypothetical protein